MCVCVCVCRNLYVFQTKTLRCVALNVYFSVKWNILTAICGWLVYVINQTTPVNLVESYGRVIVVGYYVVCTRCWFCWQDMESVRRNLSYAKSNHLLALLKRINDIHDALDTIKIKLNEVKDTLLLTWLIVQNKLFVFVQETIWNICLKVKTNLVIHQNISVSF